MKLVVALFVMSLGLAVLFWAAGLYSVVVMVRLIIGLVAALWVVASVAVMRQPPPRKTPVQRTFVIATARGLIREGDLVKLDTRTGLVERVTSLPHNPEDPVQ